jgi:hypothetical protein
MDWFSGFSLLVGGVVVFIVGVLIALGVQRLEGHRRRDEDAARLTQSLTEPLARAPALAGAGVMPVVTVPWRGRPRVELTGWVPSREIRDAAVRAVEREAARLGRPVRIVDRLEIIDDGGSRSGPHAPHVAPRRSRGAPR